MKKLILAMFVFFASNSYAIECSFFVSDESSEKSHVIYFTEPSRVELNGFIATYSTDISNNTESLGVESTTGGGGSAIYPLGFLFRMTYQLETDEGKAQLVCLRTN